MVTAAGQRPSCSGYGRSPFSGTARQGEKYAKTLPNSTLAKASPTQNVMKTKVVAKLLSGFSVPASPAPMTATSTTTPTSRQAHSSTREPRTPPPGSGRQFSRARRGCGHSTASATKETTRTSAAAAANSPSGIGSVARWIRPCAKTLTTGVSA